MYVFDTGVGWDEIEILVYTQLKNNEAVLDLTLCFNSVQSLTQNLGFSFMVSEKIVNH